MYIRDEFNRVSIVTHSLGSNIATSYTYASPTDDTLVAESTGGDIPTPFSTTYARDSLQRATETTVMVGDYGHRQALEYVPRQNKEQSGQGEIVVPTAVLPPVGWVTKTVGTTNYVSKFKQYTMSGTTPTLVASEDVEYDANGNITKYGDVTYEYDKLGRLTKEINPTIDRIKVWCYDISGNITSRTEHKYTTGEDLGTFVYEYESGWKDQLKSFNGQVIKHDQAGNPTTYRGATLSWTRGRLLKSYNSITMEYNADGIRSQKAVPGTHSSTTTEYIYSGNNLLQEKVTLAGISQSSTIYRAYIYNSQGIIGFVQGGNSYSYRKNLFGDIVAIYQGATKVAEYAYDAWGNCTVIDPTTGLPPEEEGFIGNVNPFRYRGYYWDNDLQLYYLMSRYYDPQTGRFINADSLEYLAPETIGGLNLYAYCGNNPVMCVDPTGTLSIILIAGLIGFGISFFSSIISQAIEDGEVKLSVALIDGVFGAIDGALSAMGLKMNLFLSAFMDMTLDYVNSMITTLIENGGNITTDDMIDIGKSIAITGIFSVVSAGFNLGFDDDFVWRANKEIKNINKKLSKGLYKTTKKAISAEKTIYSYISQAFNNPKVYYNYGVDILATISKGIAK